MLYIKSIRYGVKRLARQHITRVVCLWSFRLIQILGYGHHGCLIRVWLPECLLLLTSLNTVNNLTEGIYKSFRLWHGLCKSQSLYLIKLRHLWCHIMPTFCCINTDSFPVLGVPPWSPTLRTARLQSLLELWATAFRSSAIPARSLFESAFIEHILSWYVQIYIDGYKLLCYRLEKRVHQRGIWFKVWRCNLAGIWGI